MTQILEKNVKQRVAGLLQFVGFVQSAEQLSQTGYLRGPGVDLQLPLEYLQYVLLVVGQNEFVFICLDQFSHCAVRCNPNEHVGIEARRLYQVVEVVECIGQARTHVSE